MEVGALQVCKFHQYGHCKYGSSCRRFHTENSCSDTNCDKTLCTLRHPRSCKHLSRHGHCQFGAGCSYSHSISPPRKCLEADFKIIQEELKLVKTVLEMKVAEIDHLKEKVNSLEDIVVSMKSEHSGSSFDCNICEYKCKSEKALKNHETRKHRQEILRESEDINESLQMSPGHSDRINDVSDDPCEKPDSSLPLQEKETDTLNSPSKIEFTHFTSVPIIYNFKCDICDKKYHLKTCLDDHINIEHNPNIPPPSKWEKNNCHHCNTLFKNNMDFQTHMWLEHGV